MKRTLTSLWALLLLAGSPTQGHAQEQAEAAPSTSEAEPAAAGDPSAQEPQTMVEAREHVGRGMELYDQGNFDAALVEFQAAYELMAGHTRQFLVLYNIGQCYESLFRYDEAMRYYRRYLEAGGDEADDAPEVRAKISLLEGLLGTIRIHVSSGDSETPLESYAVWVDDQELGDDLESLMVPGGNHVVEIRAAGFVARQENVQLPARQERELSFELEPLAEEYAGVSSTYFWASTGVAVVAAGIGVAFGLSALSKRNSVNNRLDPSDPTVGLGVVTQSDLDDINNTAVRADIFFGIAGLFAVTSLTLAFLTDWGSSEDESAPTQARIRLFPVASRDAAGLTLMGSF
ncbi:MAG: tetratricopeptide repeat protein [Deltaproteobacteria bacterium]|nr:tetratricopeptide repeat protein [Deltaproteobacteria bacterium]